ncbi:MAG: YHS domain-containing protein [Chloroflexota bacterium]
MAQAIDPVCGMTVDTETAEHKSEYEGTTYYFCAAGCKRSFDKNPTEFINAGNAEGEGSKHSHGA